MRSLPRYCSLSTIVLAMTLMAISVRESLDNRSAALGALDDWDIPQLADCLNRAGLEVQLRSTRKDGAFTHNAFLTTIPNEWEELNRLSKSPSPGRLQEWRGVVYCERVGIGEPGLHLWGDRYLAIGPFYFYGDVELLERIGAILQPSAPAKSLPDRGR